MKVFKSFMNRNFFYTFTNKFVYKNLAQITKLKKIVLSFKVSSNLKKIAVFLLALKLISSKKKGCKITIAKKPNLVLKIKKGNPIGCKIILSQKQMVLFLNKMVFTITFARNTKNFKHNSYSFYVKNLLTFKTINVFYSIFDDFNKTKLNVTLTFENSTQNKLLFFLKNFLKC